MSPNAGQSEYKLPVQSSPIVDLGAGPDESK